jgi:hypothetical protein
MLHRRANCAKKLLVLLILLFWVELSDIAPIPYPPLGLNASTQMSATFGVMCESLAATEVRRGVAAMAGARYEAIEKLSCEGLGGLEL